MFLLAPYTKYSSEPLSVICYVFESCGLDCWSLSYFLRLETNPSTNRSTYVENRSSCTLSKVYSLKKRCSSVNPIDLNRNLSHKNKLHFFFISIMLQRPRRRCEGTAMGAIDLDLRPGLGIGPFSLGNSNTYIYICMYWCICVFLFLIYFRIEQLNLSVIIFNGIGSNMRIYDLL